MRGKLVHELKLLVRVRVWGWVRVMVKFGTSSAFRGWVRVLGYGFGVKGRKVKSRDCVHLTRCLNYARCAPLVAAPLVAARGAREGLWSELSNVCALASDLVRATIITLTRALPRLTGDARLEFLRNSALRLE